MAKTIICIGILIGVCDEQPTEITPATTTTYPTTTSTSMGSSIQHTSPNTSVVGGINHSLLACIRSYEGDYTSDTGNGYYGAYQFDDPTWYSVGGVGNPADAKKSEQDYRAWLLYLSRGLQPWPTPQVMCGHLE